LTPIKPREKAKGNYFRKKAQEKKSEGERPKVRSSGFRFGRQKEKVTLAKDAGRKEMINGPRIDADKARKKVKASIAAKAQEKSEGEGPRVRGEGKSSGSK
jgi:hypothetical protein